MSHKIDMNERKQTCSSHRIGGRSSWHPDDADWSTLERRQSKRKSHLDRSRRHRVESWSKPCRTLSRPLPRTSPPGAGDGTRDWLNGEIIDHLLKIGKLAKKPTADEAESVVHSAGSKDLFRLQHIRVATIAWHEFTGIHLFDSLKIVELVRERARQMHTFILKRDNRPQYN
jgi:hypothetical protein